MRRWTLTAFLAATAVAAAWMAPRLLGGARTAPQADVSPPDTVAPAPLPDAFWHDAVDCGMG